MDLSVVWAVMNLLSASIELVPHTGKQLGSVEARVERSEVPLIRIQNFNLPQCLLPSIFGSPPYRFQACVANFSIQIEERLLRRDKGRADAEGASSGPA
jgi:hypothetical protein